MPSETAFPDMDAYIAALAEENPEPSSEAGKAALAFILQDIDRIMARLDVGIAEENKRLDALLESLNAKQQ
jgi:hypothetical protein